jgi:hypothetical protein
MKKRFFFVDTHPSWKIRICLSIDAHAKSIVCVIYKPQSKNPHIAQKICDLIHTPLY